VGFDDFNKQGRIMDLIKNIFYFIRSSIYMVYFTILSICLGLALPFAFLGNARAITDRVGRTWTWCVLFGLKYICGISWEFKGLKNLPQGTRVPVGKTTEEYPYKAGVLALVRGFKCDVVPMALNSGQFWAKKQFLKKPGKIIVEFMRPIKYEEIAKMDKKEFMNRLESLIEEKSKKLLV
jgi:1-acyl-sn-glycerol-3-phosphate acyltransferase